MRRFVISCVLLGLAGMANAATITWTFTGANTDLGTTANFTSGGITIQASGFTSNGVAGDLYGKNLGGDEVGLGMNADPTGNHEIYFGTDFIQLDLTNVLAQHVGNLQIAMDSSTGGETWRVYNTSSAGTLVGATTLFNGSDEAAHSISPTLQYLDIFVTGPSPHGNVLVSQLTGTSSVPEPSSVALVLLGLGFVGARWNKSRRQN
jgi:hypothetical protein